MAMPAFEDVILKKQWVPTHMVRIMLVCMPVTLQRYVQNKEKTKCTNVKITWLFYVEALQNAVTPVVQIPKPVMELFFTYSYLIWENCWSQF